MSASQAAGLLHLVGALFVFAGSAAVGALLAVLTEARRLRSTRRLRLYAIACGVVLTVGVGLTRGEARAIVAAFAVVPLAAGFLMARMDLRKDRGGAPVSAGRSSGSDS